MKLKHVIALFSLLLSTSVQAQNQQLIDSLKSVIKEARHDTLVCRAYLTRGEDIEELDL